MGGLDGKINNTCTATTHYRTSSELHLRNHLHPTITKVTETAKTYINYVGYTTAATGPER
jgi:hypothetical protein